MRQSLPQATFGDISKFLQRYPNPLLARVLPYSLLRSYIRSLGFFYYQLNRKQRQIVVSSYLTSLNGQVEWHNKNLLLKKMFLGIFDHYAEKLFFAFKPPATTYRFLTARSRIQNASLLDRMIALGGGLLVTGHFGAVEFLAGVLASNNYQVAMIARFKTQILKKALSRVVRYYDILAIDADEGLALTKGIRAVRKGRILITLCDEFKYWRPDNGNQVNIFGALVPADRTLNILYNRLKSPACLGVLSRSSDRYDLFLEQLADGKDCPNLSTMSWKILAEYISRYPEQWYQWSSVAKGLATYRLKER